METQNFLSQHNYRLRPDETFKKRSYRFFHQILQQYNVNSKIYPVFLIIEMLQFIHFTVHQSFDGIWQTQGTQITIKILSFFDLSSVWKLPFHDIILIIFISISDILLSTVLIIFLYEIFKKHTLLPYDRNIFGSKIIVYVDLLLRTVLFLPLAIAFSHYIKEPIDYLKPIMATLTIIGQSCLILISFTLSIFIIQNNPFENIPFAMPVSNIQLVKIIIKILMSIYILIDLPKNKMNAIFLVLVIFGFGYIAYKIFKGQRLIHSPNRYFYEIGIITPIWFSVVTLIQVVVTSDENLSFLFLFIGAVGCNFGWFWIMSKKSQNLLRSSYKTISCVNEIIEYNLQSIRCVLDYQNPYSILCLQGILNYHQYNCKKTKENCICHKIRETMNNFTMIKDNDDQTEELKCWYEFIKGNLQEVKGKYLNNAQITLFLAYIEKQKLKNKFRALHNLEDNSHFVNGPKYEFLNYHFKRKIESLIFEEDRLRNQKKTVDINNFLDFEMKYFELQKQIEKSANDHIKFWSSLKSDSISMSKILKGGTEIQKRTENIIKLFEKLMSINHNNIQMLILYGNFMRIVVNYSEIYEKNQEIIEAIKKSSPQNMKILDTEKQKYGDNSMTGVIIISGERKDIGVIKHCSSKVTDLLGYNTYELVSQNINILMPQFIGNMHDDVLRNYLELQNSGFDFIERLAPMIDRNHFMVIAKILTKPIPSLLNGLQLIGIFNVTQQFHKQHPQENPKYILYRSDSGYIQALSQSCFQQAGYRICKIDEKNQTNVELDINSVFSNLHGNLNDLGGQKSVQGKIKIKDIDGEIVQAETIIYARHQIFYFGVKLKLLQFFWKKNEYYPQKDTTYASEFTKKFQIKEQQHQKSQLSDRASKLGRSQISQLLKDDKDKEQNNFQPLSLKILKKLGIVFIVVLTIIACLLLVYNLHIAPQLNFQRQLTNYGLKSLGRIIDINFYSRLMHLSQFFKTNTTITDIFKFQQYQSNLTILNSLLQTEQFDFVSLQIQATSDDFGEPFQIFTYKPLVNSTPIDFQEEKKTLDTAVFDFVTSTSTFSSSAKQQMNFPLSLTTATSPYDTYAAYETFFHLHYTGLYQIIGNKFQLNTKLSNYFKQNNLTIKNLLIVFYSVTVSVLIVFSLVIVPLTFIVVNLTQKIIILFGLLTTSQINDEVKSCQLFLEIFYEQSYFVRLKRRAQAQNNRQANNSFEIDPVMLKRFTTTISPIIEGENEQSFFSNNAPTIQQGRRGTSSSIINTMNKNGSTSTRLEIKEKKYEQRSSQELILADQNNPNPASLNATPLQQEEEIIDKLKDSTDYTKAIICGCWILTFIIVAMLFAGKVIYLSTFVDNTEGRIYELELLFKNLNLIKSLKVFALESTISDNETNFSPFFLKETFQKYQSQLLNGEKQLSELIKAKINSNSQYNIENEIYMGQQKSICEFLDKIIEAQSNFNLGSFNKDQCESIDNNLLTQGYRETLIGYIETLKYLSTLGKTNNTQIFTPTIDLFISDPKFKMLLQYQKYFEGLNTYFALGLSETIQTNIHSAKTVIIVYFVCMVIGITIGVLIGWAKSMHWLSGQIRTAMKIAGLIPKRVLSKNNKLLHEYQQIENLLSK